MKDDLRRRRGDFLISTGYFLVIALLVWFSIKFLLPFFAPFILGFLVAFILKPVSRFFCCRLHWNSKACGAIVIFLAYALLLIGLWFIGGKLIILLQELALTAKDIFEQYLSPVFSDFSGFLSRLIYNISPELAVSADSLLNGVSLSLENCKTHILPFHRLRSFRT